MKNIIILNLCICFSLFSFGQKKAIISELKKSGGLYYLNGTVFSGLAFEMYNESQFKKKFYFLNGKPHGKGINYYKNGQIEYDMNFFEGKEQGKQLRYRQDGSLDESKNYSNGKYEGKQIFYFANGNISYEESFKNGRRHGKKIDYFVNGKISSEKNYNEGISIGRHYSLSESGKILSDEYYINGELDGKKIRYNEGYVGGIESENNYSNGKQNGVQIYYNNNGKKSREVNYINGELDGKEIIYNEDYFGGISIEKNYKNGKRDGKYTSYFQDGKVYEEINFKEDKRNGICVKYYGIKDYGFYTKMYEFNYKDDIQEGRQIEFNRDGTIAYEKSAGIQNNNKSDVNIDVSDDENKVFTKVEVEADYPGGTSAWRKCLSNNLDSEVPGSNGAPPGQYTVIVRFIVAKDGSVSDVQAESSHGYGMEQESIRAIRKSGKWVPASQNGKNVTSYKRQPIGWIVANN